MRIALMIKNFGGSSKILEKNFYYKLKRFSNENVFNKK